MPSPRLTVGRHSCRNAAYAITSVIRGRKPLLADAGHASLVMREFARCEDEGRVDNVAWVVMPDHIHWLFRLREGAIGASVQAFKSRTARGINDLRASSGPVWQAGYYDHCIRDEEDLTAQARYLITNPLRRGLVARLADYPYWHCAWLRAGEDL